MSLPPPDGESTMSFLQVISSFEILSKDQWAFFTCTQWPYRNILVASASSSYLVYCIPFRMKDCIFNTMHKFILGRASCQAVASHACLIVSTFFHHPSSDARGLRGNKPVLPGSSEVECEKTKVETEIRLINARCNVRCKVLPVWSR